MLGLHASPSKPADCPAGQRSDARNRHIRRLTLVEAAEPRRERAEAERELANLRNPLIGYFRRRMGDQDDVADLVQEVFLRLAARSAAEPIGNLHGYAFQVAASVLADRHRRQSVRQYREHSSLDADVADVADIAPDRVLEARSALSAVCTALETLPQRTQTIFVLRRIEGMRYHDIAARLGISVSAVEKHMVRAVQHLAGLRRLA